MVKVLRLKLERLEIMVMEIFHIYVVIILIQSMFFIFHILIVFV